MKVLGILAVLTAVLLCIRAVPAPCSSCIIDPVPSTGPCAYCHEPTNTSEDGGMRTLFYTLFNTLPDLEAICGNDSNCKVIPFYSVSPDVDVHNDRINGQLEVFLVLQKQADVICGALTVTTLLNICTSIRDKVYVYVQATRDYLENQHCGCLGHEECCYDPAFQIPDDETSNLNQLIEDVYSQVVLTTNIIRKIKHLDWGIPEQYNPN